MRLIFITCREESFESIEKENFLRANRGEVKWILPSLQSIYEKKNRTVLWRAPNRSNRIETFKLFVKWWSTIRKPSILGTVPPKSIWKKKFVDHNIWDAARIIYLLCLIAGVLGPNNVTLPNTKKLKALE